MNKHFTIIMVALFCTCFNVIAQEVEFTARASHDTIALGDAFQLTYELKNGHGKFEAPDLSEFQIYSGPNYSSSFALINGETSMSMSYSYELKPVEKGEFIIEPAMVQIDGISLKTEPIRIVVKIDPDRPPAEVNPMKPQKSKRKKSIKI